MARFRQEIRLARKVTDSHVCRIHELLESGGKVFLTMEYLEAETLSARIERDGPLPESEAKEIARQVLAAMTAAHEAGVIHRDLKSGNIMLAKRADSGLRVVVTDFGLACEVQREEHRLTVTGAVMGTPDYMAPEQFAGGEITPAADIYALGILLYELLTGVLPFQAATPLGAAVVRAKRPPAVSTLREGIPRHWDAVISRCLEYEPDKRWSSAREVEEALFGPDAARRSAGARKWSARGTLAVAILAMLLTSAIVWGSI
jgi:serine/threonine-protein kinase